jgi:signal-transduction protein with cAMP-binding, CBS, and nucleotidyltransferase domain
MTALEQLNDHNVGRLLVMDDGQFVGLLTRTDIMTALSIIESGGHYQSEPAEDRAVAETVQTEEFRER